MRHASFHEEDDDEDDDVDYDDDDIQTPRIRDSSFCCSVTK